VAMQLACEMAQRNQAGSIVALACDSGDRYMDSYYDDAWLASNRYDIAPYVAQLEEAWLRGVWRDGGGSRPAGQPGDHEAAALAAAG